jgi:hypothetical protein
MRAIHAAVVAVLAGGSVTASQMVSPSQSVPTLSEDIVGAVQTLTMNTPYGSLPRGLADSAGRSTKLLIVSNRNMIALETAEATGSSGRFNPGSEMRWDVVLLFCGDHDAGQIFECARLQVSVNGVEVKPLSYEAQRNSYGNALGANWDVREVFAVFDARRLTNGFVVDYADPTGAEWTYAITPEQAAVDLLLDLASASAATVPAGPVPPALRISVTRPAQGWRITNADSFRWPLCVASIGASEASIGAFEPNGSVMVNPSQFQPPLNEQAAKSPVTVTCTVGRDQVFIATERP